MLELKLEIAKKQAVSGEQKEEEEIKLVHQKFLRQQKLLDMELELQLAENSQACSEVDIFGNQERQEEKGFKEYEKVRSEIDRYNGKYQGNQVGTSKDYKNKSEPNSDPNQDIQQIFEVLFSGDLVRLRKCLPGRKREIVRPLLTSSSNLDTILESPEIDTDTDESKNKSGDNIDGQPAKTKKQGEIQEPNMTQAANHDHKIDVKDENKEDSLVLSDDFNEKTGISAEGFALAKEKLEINFKKVTSPRKVQRKLNFEKEHKGRQLESKAKEMNKMKREIEKAPLAIAKIPLIMKKNLTTGKSTS